MKKLIFSLLVVSQIAYSQTEKSVGDFNKVTSFDKIDVVLIPSDRNKVVLNGSGSDEVEVVNKNGELKIRMPLTKLLSGDNVSATVYFKEIDAVEANEGSRISCETTFDTTIFDVIAKEGSEVTIKINIEKLNLRVANGSIVSISGNATNQDVIVNSGGNYNAEKLTTKQTTITSNAGGNATIFATNLVDAKVRAGGKIFIYGSPKQINQKIIAGGKIEEVK